MNVKLTAPRKILQKFYPKGVHEMPDEAKKDWFFQAQLKDGSASIVQELAPAEAPKSALEPSISKPAEAKAKK